MIQKLLAAVLFLCANLTLIAQSEQAIYIAKSHLESNLEALKLLPEDVADLHLQDSYTDKKTGATYLYFIQRHEGIEIYNAIFNIVLDKNDQPVHFGNRLIPNLKERVLPVGETISAKAAVLAAARELGAISSDKSAGAEAKVDLVLKKRINEREFIFHERVPKNSESSISESEIPIKFCYQKLPSGKLKAAWNLSIDMPNSDDFWSVRTDALTGEILNKNNFTVYCDFGENCSEHHSPRPLKGSTPEHLQKDDFQKNNFNVFNNSKPKLSEQKDIPELSSTPLQGSGATALLSGSYWAFPLPFESPNHGSQSILHTPHDSTASPFGWHDTDGIVGADFTITRGNNAHAYLDEFNRNESQGDEPDGGTDLVFPYAFDGNIEPTLQPEAAVTNLFYVTNWIHDFSYAYGFTEEAGNFQANNYGKGGSEDDFVESQAQDGGGENNANFSTPADGGKPRMQMFLWSGGEQLEVTKPAEVAGWYYTGSALYGPDIDANTDISGELILGQDSVFSASNTDGCEPFKNADKIAGNIVIVDRGTCWYKEKSLFAEAAGAKACIICNFNETAVDLGGTNAVPGNPNIPTISLGNGDCQRLKEAMKEGKVEISIKQRNAGIQKRDASFDNGIIVHEYAHGISNRMTAGRFNTGCLSNVEQAGEGWSDFFTLVATTTVTNRNEPKSIGTYSRRENTDGLGLRPFLYTNDMDLNPTTYADVAHLSIPHGVGFVWASMLWDLYLAMADEHGFHNDPLNGDGGNNKAIQLVMEGLRTQPCRPGFEDARDAILAADRMLYNGENQCLIWEVFARRGLGFYADQGHNNILGDEVLSFEAMPSCIRELKIEKTSDPLANAGDDISIELKILNHKNEIATGVVITDELPEGLTFVEIETASGIDQSDISIKTDVPGFVSFEIGKDLATDEEISIKFKVATDPSKYSIRMEFDEVPDGSTNTENKWLAAIEAGGGNNNVDNIWRLSETGGVSDDWAWSVDDHELETIQALYSAESFRISGKQPTIRFYHKYYTFPGQHGGVFEISNDGGVSFENRPDLFFRNGYPGLISYQSFVVPNFYAFSGSNRNYHASYLDMNEFAEEDLFFRFRLGTRNIDDFEGETSLDYFLSQNGGTGWQVDNFEILDLFNYDGEACVTSAAGDNACAKAPERGTIIESQISTSAQDLSENTEVSVYPNPANETIHLAFLNKKPQEVNVNIFSLSGKSVNQQSLQVSRGEQVFSMNIGHLPSGIYFINIQSEEGVVTEKVIIK